MKISLLSRIDNKIPEILIYKHSRQPFYNMFNSKTSEFLGSMCAYPDNFKGKMALCIDSLYMVKRGKSYGSSFLDFAKNLSRKEYHGTVFLNASSILEEDSGLEPHAFYRKNGFTTDNKKILEKIDDSIKSDKALTFFDVPPIIMYWQARKK